MEQKQILNGTCRRRAFIIFVKKFDKLHRMYFISAMNSGEVTFKMKKENSFLNGDSLQSISTTVI